jgi:predicted phosphodiesterase
MRLAVVSDIHSNYEACREVLRDIDRSRVDAVISLGDNIGYGPEPDRIIQEIKARNISTILGNHELAIKDKKYLKWFNPAARISLIQNRGLLSQASIRFISQLDPVRVAYGCRFVHGFPPASALLYMFQMSDNKKRNIMEDMAESLCFIGHTHTLEIVAYDGGLIESNALSEGLTGLHPEKKYIVNIGSVGQPRDGTNKAKYVIWDSSENTIDVRFISYDIAAVVRKIRAAGLPEQHAQRLW